MGSLLTLALAGTPGRAGATINRPAAERKVARLVAAAYSGVSFTSITCPARLRPPRGVELRCRATLAGGVLSVDLVRTAQGRKDVTYAMQTRQAVVDITQLQAFIAANATLTATVDCGGTPWLVVTPGDTISCRATLADGVTRSVDVLIRDRDGAAVITHIR